MSRELVLGFGTPSAHFCAVCHNFTSHNHTIYYFKELAGYRMEGATFIVSLLVCLIVNQCGPAHCNNYIVGDGISVQVRRMAYFDQDGHALKKFMFFLPQS